MTLTIPDTAVILENPGIEEPGLGATTERRDGHDAMCAVVSDCCSFTRRATFTIDTMTAGEPAWQYHERRARDLMPAFVSGGLFLLVIGAGVLGMIRLKYPPWRIRQDATGDGPALPADIEAALATDRYPKHLKPAMIATGLIDAERSNVARDLGRAAIATLVLGVLTWIVAVTWFGHLGPWPLSIPIGILFSAGMFWLGARRMPILSQRGVLARDRVLYSARVRDGQPKA